MGDVPKGEIPEGSTQEVSQTYTLENEREGDTLGRRKELRAEGDEVEKSSKSPKSSLLSDGTT